VLERLETVARATWHALELLYENSVGVNPWWILGGVVLHVIAQAVRTRGWFNIIRAAYPKADDLRARDVMAAFFAGSGLNAVVPARGGDVMKLVLVQRKVKEAHYSTLLATFIPETLFETLLGIALVIWALSKGFLPLPDTDIELPSIDISLVIAHPFISAVVATLLAVGVVLFFRRLKRTAEDVVKRLRQGLVVLDSPRQFVTGVVSWQALSRVIRLGSLACFMAAFKLPVGISSVVLVMAAQGGGRIIPLAPASAGLRIAMLSYGLVETSGQAVDIAAITAFSFGVSFVLLVVSVAIAMAIIARQLGTLNPKHAVAAARAAAAQWRAGPAGVRPA